MTLRMDHIKTNCKFLLQGLCQLRDERTPLLTCLTDMNKKCDEASVDNKILNVNIETLRTKVNPYNVMLYTFNWTFCLCSLLSLKILYEFTFRHHAVNLYAF